MAKLLPVLLLIIGVGIGGGAGLALKTPPEDCPEEPCPEAAADDEEEKAETEPNYVRLKNQFVIPVVRDDRVHSLVVMDDGRVFSFGQGEKGQLGQAAAKGDLGRAALGGMGAGTKKQLAAQFQGSFSCNLHFIMSPAV